MFDRFTDRARNVMGHARDASRRAGGAGIDSACLLLGILALPTGVAIETLKGLGVDLAALRARIEPPPGSPPCPEPGQVPFTADARKVLEAALAASEDLGHHDIGSEHLLLGILRVRSPSLAPALDEFRLEPEKVRAEIVRFLGDDRRSGLETIPAEDYSNAAVTAVVRQIIDHLSAQFMKLDEMVAHAQDLLRSRELEDLDAQLARMRDWVVKRREWGSKP